MDENNWPTIPDGSKMLFTPILRGELSEEVITDLTESMDLQTQLKADEVLMDIDIQHIYEKKICLNNKSIEYVLHRATVKIDETTEIPIFKHICRKWMIDASTVRYQVAVQRQMVEKAEKYLTTLKENLIGKYGSDIKRHFIQKKNYRNQQGSQKSNTYMKQPNDEDNDP